MNEEIGTNQCTVAGKLFIEYPPLRNEGKGIPSTGHEGPRGDVDARVHIYTATAAIGRGRVAKSYSRAFMPGTHF